MRFPLLGIPNTITRIIDISVSMKRLSTFMGAQEAHRVGLVTTLTPADSLTATVDEMAERILHAPALALWLTKHCIDQGARTDLNSGIRIELAAIDRLLSESDWKGSVDRFGQQIGSAVTEKKA